MRILVTGGAGFVGSCLVNRLIEQGHSVIVLDNLDSGMRSRLHPKAEFQFCDVAVDTPPPLRGVEIIYHLAAVSRIMSSFERPVATYLSNVAGTARVVQWARTFGAKLVYTGSSTAEPGQDETIIDSPYAHSKHVGEQILELYSRYGLVACTCRFFNVYGPGGDSGASVDSVVTVFERQRKQGVPLTIMGTGEQRRDFIHVEDVVRGVIAAGEYGKPGAVYRLGTGVDYSVNEVAAMFGGPVERLPDRPGERRRTCAVGECPEINWRAQYDLRTYIASLR